MTKMLSTMPSTSQFSNSGYSLVELVITIIVIGILAAVVLPNMDALGQHRVNTQADEFRRNLSHIQLMAISQSQRLRLTINAAGTNYSVFSCANAACAAPVAVIDPNTGAIFSVNLTNGVTLAPVNNNLDFDSLGRPQAGGALIAAIPARAYTLSGSGRNVTVSVLPITGFAS